MYTIHRNDSRQTQYSVEPEKGFTRNDIVSALQNGMAKLSGDKIIQKGEGETVLMGTVKGEEASSNVEWL